MTSEPSKYTLDQSLLIIESLTPLLIRSGVGYTEFAAALKPIFYRQALKEANRTGQKSTDSAISLLSGLHRRDTASMRKAMADDPALANPPISKPTSIPKQVIARWLSQDIGDTLPLVSETSEVISFASIVSQVSKDQHFRSILNELERLGVVLVQDKSVTLKRNAFTPDPHLNEARELLAQNVSDHISAGLTNLFANVADGDTGVLEQAIFSDNLTKESVDELHKLANELWFNTLDSVLKRAIELYEQDQPQLAADKSLESFRFRLGMYAYNEVELEADAETVSIADASANPLPHNSLPNDLLLNDQESAL